MILTRKHRHRAAFTIVELLIVIVVIGVLAAITVVAYNGIQQRARASQATSALSQAKKKLELYKVDNGSYPVSGSLASAGVADADVDYQYTSSGTTYCLTATIASVSYKATDSAAASPGGCAGHGQGGVAAITNYYTDPKPASTAPAGAWDGANTPMTFTNVASTWSASGRANRMAFPATISTNNGGPTPILSAVYLPYAGQKYTIAISLRLISGSAGIGNASIDRNGTPGTVVTHAVGGNGIPSMSTSQTYRVYITFTADTAATNGTNLRLYVNINNKSSGCVVEYADIDFYPGDYSNRNWASGDSTNWIWNGTANNATSTGPPI
jgi:prepilin-type N-terminal cleavage/methylation domain-containing protein